MEMRSFFSKIPYFLLKIFNNRKKKRELSGLVGSDSIRKESSVQWSFFYCLMESSVSERNANNGAKMADDPDNDAKMKQIIKIYEHEGRADKHSSIKLNSNNIEVEQHLVHRSLSKVLNEFISTVVLNIFNKKYGFFEKNDPIFTKKLIIFMTKNHFAEATSRSLASFLECRVLNLVVSISNPLLFGFLLLFNNYGWNKGM